MALQPISKVWYPKHPVGSPVDPATLNNHLRILTDGTVDSQTAFQSLMARLRWGTVAVSVNAASNATVTVKWASAFKDTAYIALASVEGSSLYVQNVLRSTGSLQVTIVNNDGANPHTGTVMALGFHT